MKWFRDINPQIIQLKQISHITKQVTEEIKPKYLNSFLQTSLIQSKIVIPKTPVVYFIYIEKSKTYEIYLFSTNKKRVVLEPQFLEQYYKELEIEPIGYDIFITKEFFAIFCDGKLHLFKENKNYSQEDIEQYINFTYSFEVSNIYHISYELFMEYKKQYRATAYLNFKKIETRYDGHIFLIYFSLAIFGFFYFYGFNQSEQRPIFVKSNEIDINEQKRLVMPALIKLGEGIKRYGLSLKSFKCETKIYTSFFGKKDNLYNFLASDVNGVKIIKIVQIGGDFVLAEVEIEF